MTSRNVTARLKTSLNQASVSDEEDEDDLPLDEQGMAIVHYHNFL